MKDQKKLVWKFQGTLNREKKAVDILLVISLAALGLSVILEYAGQAVFKQCYDSLHLDFVMNVLLGIAGSASISYLCLLFPFLDKKDRQVSSLRRQVRQVYCDYISLLNLVQVNSERTVDNNSYVDEVVLWRDSKELSEHANRLSEMYSELEISCEDIDKIIEHVPYMMGLSKTVESFLKVVLASVSDVESEMDLVGKSDEHFDEELNREEYQALARALEVVISKKTMDQLFGAFICQEDSEIQNVHSSTRDLKNALMNQKVTKACSGAIIQLNKELIQIIDTCGRRRDKMIMDILGDLYEIRDKIKGFSQEKAAPYNKEIDAIWALNKEKKYVAAYEKVNQLKEKLAAEYAES